MFNVLSMECIDEVEFRIISEHQLKALLILFAVSAFFLMCLGAVNVN